MTSNDRLQPALRGRPSRWLVILFLALVVVVPDLAQNPLDGEDVWNAFVTWLDSAEGEVKLQDYATALAGGGLPKDEVDRQLSVIRRLLSEEPERGIELTYDRIFSKPLTGDSEQDGFTSTPSEFMTESVIGLTPGTALDVGAGQGRNAVWLATQGWEVTAIDLSSVGLAAARASAERAGKRIDTVKTSYEAFDFGSERWDMILMILSWAPVSDPVFVARLERSLRPDGVIVFEHVIDKPEEPFPPMVHALQPDELRAHFAGFTIEYYDESVQQGDWGGPPTPLVRMIARKQPPAATS